MLDFLRRDETWQIAGAPVAVFDSGLGGISVLRELVRTLPMENYLYFGDSLHAPYGTKTPEEVTQLSLQAAQKLLAQGAKALVVACNTATSALPSVTAAQSVSGDLPIVGTEPAHQARGGAPSGRQNPRCMATAMTVQAGEVPGGSRRSMTSRRRSLADCLQRADGISSSSGDSARSRGA